MFRRCLPSLWVHSMSRVWKTPSNGYDISELPNEDILAEFLAFYKEKLVVTVVHNGLNPTAPHVVEREFDPLMAHFIRSLNHHNFGNPAEVKFALVPLQSAKKFVETHKVLAAPTCMLMHNNAAVQRTVGIRHGELQVKCLFFLRNNDKNIFSVM